MGLILRNVTGSALSFDQLDNNFLFLSSSYLQTASFNATTSSFSSGSFTGSFIGALTGTASWSSNSVSSSYALSSSYASTSSFINPLNQT
jgi:hypothetical protein